MCEKTNHIQLCTCAIGEVSSIQAKFAAVIGTLGRKETLSVLKWKLSAFDKRSWSGMDGMMMMPSKQLTAEISDTYLQEQLNARNCFDNHYIPLEGDELLVEIGWIFDRKGKSLKRNADSRYLSFIYQKGIWTIDCYNPFYDVTTLLQQGVVKRIS